MAMEKFWIFLGNSEIQSNLSLLSKLVFHRTYIFIHSFGFGTLVIWLRKSFGKYFYRTLYKP